MYPDEPQQVRQYGFGNLAGTYVLHLPRPARQTDEVPEIGPHDLGPQHAVLRRAFPDRLFHQPLEVGRARGSVPPRRMLGVAAPVLAENVPELRVVKERPYLRVVGALEVIARLPGPPRLEQNLEVLLGVARYPRVVERRTQQRAPAARRRADQIRELGLHRATASDSPDLLPIKLLPQYVINLHQYNFVYYHNKEYTKPLPGKRAAAHEACAALRLDYRALHRMCGGLAETLSWTLLLRCAKGVCRIT